MRRGAARARLYLQQRHPALEAALVGRGYRPRDEVGFIRLTSGVATVRATAAAPRVSVHPVEGASGWLAKLVFHRQAPERPDGHASSAEEWVELEERKAAAGYMQAFLIRVGDEVVGAVAAAPQRELLRVKNLVVHPAHRRQGVATEIMDRLEAIAAGSGKRALGCFALAGEAPETMYRRCGFQAVTRQTEWLKDLSRRRDVLTWLGTPSRSGHCGQPTRSSVRGRASAVACRLSQEHVSRYWAEGFVAVRGVFSGSEALVWRDECDRLWAADSSYGMDSRIQWRGHTTKGAVVDRFDPVIDISPVFHRLAHDDRLLDAARSVLGSEVAVVKDKLITKRPGTMGYGMHQDFPYWASFGIPADAIVTAQISIDAAGRENGAIEVFPGLHRRQLEAPPEEPRDVDESKMDLSQGRVVESQPGDILLFHSLVPHRSAPNTSLQSRRAFFVTYTSHVSGDVYERSHAGKYHDAFPRGGPEAAQE